MNYVGVDVNTASPALLRYVSGLNQLTARRVYEHRLPATARSAAASNSRRCPASARRPSSRRPGFLKIAGGDNPLDATWIHPESYAVAERVLAKLGCTRRAICGARRRPPRWPSRSRRSTSRRWPRELDVGMLTLKDILAQLARPGRDPREDLPAPVFKQGVLKLEDLTAGMELTGTVLNVVDFGAFVDIGMHDSGLVHVSQLANRFVRDPHDVVAVGDIVKVWVVEVDKERRRVSLTMIPPGTQKPPRPERREDKPEGQPRPEGQKRPPSRPASRPPARPRPATDGKPRGKSDFRGKGKPREIREYKPKPPPKPVVPITEKMKSGAEPMRTFGDLAQFFQTKSNPNKDDSPGPEERREARREMTPLDARRPPGHPRIS